MAASVSLSSIEELNAELLRRVDLVESDVLKARDVLGSDHEADCETVESWIDECRAALADPAAVAVALLGSTGAGKSTLINSLIGAQVLPTSSLAVCTSAITRVRYAPGPEFSVEVSLVPRETWEKQLEQAAADIQASKDFDSEAGVYVTTSPIPDDEKKRICAVYGDDAFANFLASGDRGDLVEPAEIVKAFESNVIRLSASTTEELRQEVSRFLTSKDIFWPIVRTCLIQGPFGDLEHGGELVDLPGLNDPNEAREELTRQYLETARFVWVVFNMKRSLGRDLTQVLESRDLINRLLAGGRLSTLTFIGTHSDDVSSLNPEDFGLSDEATASEIALARNEAAEAELRVNLHGISQAIAVGGHQNALSVDLEKQLVNSPVFMVSASNHLQMMGKTKSKVPVIFEDPYETNVPQLSNHLRKMAIEAGPKSNAYSLVIALEKVVAELASLAQTLKTQKILKAQQGEQAKDKLLSDVRSASKALNDEASGSIDRFRGSLQEAVSRFKTSSSLDKAVVEKIIVNRVARWNAMHWATMRATANRGGRFYSSSAGEVDFIKELSAPLIAKAIGPWKEFFEKDLAFLTRQVADGLRNAVDDYATRLTAAGDGNEELKTILSALLPDLAADVYESVETAISLATKGLEAEISRRQQELHAVTEKAIESSMQEVFSQAAAQRGTGMKVRMVSILSNGSRSAVLRAIDEFEGSLSELANRAKVSVLDGILPVVAQIDEKVRRVDSMLSETGSTAASASVAEIDHFLARLSTTRSSISTQTILTEQSAESRDPGPQLFTDGAGSDSGLTAPGRVVIVDASNVSRSIPGQPPSVALLQACRTSISAVFPDHHIVCIADASLRHLVRTQSTQDDLELFDMMVSRHELVEVPAGTTGKADMVILRSASQKQAIVISNDSYKEFQGDHQWLFDDGRLFGHTFHSVLGWQFTARKPVRPRSY